MNWKKTLIEAAVILAVACLAGVGADVMRPESRKLNLLAGYAAPDAGTLRTKPLAAEPAADAPGLASVAPRKDPGLIYLEIDTGTALRMHQAGALFIDARRSESYRQGHVEHAVSIPVWEYEAEGRIAALAAGGLKPDAIMVVYCSGGDCEDAALLAGKLGDAGFYNIYLDKDGFPGWVSHGGPVAAGEQR